MPSSEVIEKVIEVPKELQKHICSLKLNLDDMETCLKFIVETKEQINKETKNIIVIESLFFSSVVLFYKCFGYNKSRTSLNENSIYKDEDSKKAFKYYKSFRDKHFVHDENCFSQCFCLAHINKIGYNKKISAVDLLSLKREPINKVDINNMHRLIFLTCEWINKYLEKKKELIASDLEKIDYKDLLNMKDFNFNFERSDVNAIRSK